MAFHQAIGCVGRRGLMFAGRRGHSWIQRNGCVDHLAATVQLRFSQGFMDATHCFLSLSPSVPYGSEYINILRTSLKLSVMLPAPRDVSVCPTAVGSREP